MKITLLVICFFIFHKALAQNQSTTVVTTDIDNFWIAYDQITSTKDSSQQYKILDRYFTSKGTPGLKAMMSVRAYTSKSYIDAIQTYPLYWNSIRKGMLKAKDYAKEITKNVERLKVLYPSLKPAKIYFTVGAFRSGGTTMDSLVLIGSEIAMADSNAETKEFESTAPGLATFLKTNPVNSLVFTNVHEYVHTQQKPFGSVCFGGSC
jgi:hypothetical protein